jgi:hypothetical protein
MAMASEAKQLLVLILIRSYVFMLVLNFFASKRAEMRAGALFYPLGDARKNLKSSADGPFHSSDMSARDI